MTPKQTYARLVNLRNTAGELLYERLTLADELLSNSAWVLDPSGGGGSESTAIDRLEADCFGDLCGALSLSQMLEILHHVPDQATWREHRYNLRKMHQEMKDREKAARRPRAERDTPAPPVPSFDECLHNSVNLDDAPTELERLREENATLRQQVRDLQRDNRKLRKVVKRVMATMGSLQGLAGEDAA